MAFNGYPVGMYLYGQGLLPASVHQRYGSQIYFGTNPSTPPHPTSHFAVQFLNLSIQLKIPPSMVERALYLLDALELNVLLINKESEGSLRPLVFKTNT